MKRKPNAAWRHDDRIDVAQLLLAAFWLGVVSVAGCGGNENTHSVTGKVSFADGTPLQKGSVVFESDEFEAYGDIASDGSYELTSYDKGDGVPAGTYRVRLEVRADAAEILEEGATERRVKSRVPERYESGATSGLECTVDGDRTFDILIE